MIESRRLSQYSEGVRTRIFGTETRTLGWLHKIISTRATHASRLGSPDLTWRSLCLVHSPKSCSGTITKCGSFSLDRALGPIHDRHNPTTYSAKTRLNMRTLQMRIWSAEVLSCVRRLWDWFSVGRSSDSSTAVSRHIILLKTRHRRSTSV